MKVINATKAVKRLDSIVTKRQAGFKDNQRVVPTKDLALILDAYLQLKEITEKNGLI